MNHKEVGRPSLLVIGPLPPPFGGIAVFNWSVYRNKTLTSRYRVFIHRTGRERKNVRDLHQAFIELRRMFRLSMHLMTHKYDIVHIHTPSYWGFAYNSVYYIIVRLLNRNAKVIVHVHSGEFIEFYKNLPIFLKYIVKKILETADLVAVTSPSWIKEFKQCVSQRLVVTYIPNGFDLKDFRIMDKVNARKRLNLPIDKKIILCVANLLPRKGHVYLIKAIERIVHHIKKGNILVVFAGDGPLRDKIEDLISKHDLTGYFSMLGWVPPKTLDLLYSASDVVVLPSLAEGAPLVLFEALGHGRPFIGTKVGGIPDIITSEEYGLLCEPKDVDCLVEKILIAIDTEWNDSAIRRYALKYTWEAISLRLLSIYKALYLR